jgi:hypothetical protein
VGQGSSGTGVKWDRGQVGQGSSGVCESEEEMEGMSLRLD